QHKAKKQKTGNKPPTLQSTSESHPAGGKTQTQTQPSKRKLQQQQQHSEPTIPFSPSDAILLIGEGDLSFAASLVSHHQCARVTATVLEKDASVLLKKYPHAAANITALATPSSPDNRILYNVDARRLTPFVRKTPGKEPVGVMNRIIFNFPHVGGKSTDVNRQVRANQELLVDFFVRALPSLAPAGSIIVTLFEGEPYTLWNVRDLARHAGLAVEKSFRFQAAAYPGYHHARTLGVVKRKDGEASEAAWKGEERLARSYVFVRKEDIAPPPAVGKKRKAKEAAGEDAGDDNE
ncbi:hypothetical protein B0H67DRAFT_449333, partial [Lasiosphaeris hirsuta]